MTVAAVGRCREVRSAHSQRSRLQFGEKLPLLSFPPLLPLPPLFPRHPLLGGRPSPRHRLREVRSLQTLNDLVYSLARTSPPKGPGPDDGGGSGHRCEPPGLGLRGDPGSGGASPPPSNAQVRTGSTRTCPAPPSGASATWPTTSARCSASGPRTCERATRTARGPARLTPPTDDVLAGWLRQASASLCDALEAAGPTAPCWTWWGEPATAGAVARHQVQEIAVHTWDAEAVAASPDPLRRDVADDGVAEFLEIVLGSSADAAAGRSDVPGDRHGRELAGRRRRAGPEAGRGQRDGVRPGADAVPTPPRGGLRRRGGPAPGRLLPGPGRHVVTELTFLGTGNFLAPPGRYWNSFVMDESVLVEPSPTALPHLRRCGVRGRRHRGGRRLALPCRPLLRMALLPPGGGRSRRWPHALRGGAARHRGAPGEHERGRCRAIGDRDGAGEFGPALRRGRRDLAGGRAAALPGSRGGSRPVSALLRLPVRPRQPGRRLLGRHHAVRTG